MFENIEIENDIPIPQGSKSNRTGLWKYLSENMEVGDSVFLENPPRNNKGQLAVMTRLYGYKPKKFKCLPEKDGARLWRVE